MTKEEIKTKDSDILARLIYRAYIAPDPHAPLEAEALLPFAAALRFYARTVSAEEAAELMADNRRRMTDALELAKAEELSAASVVIAAADAPCGDSCPVEYPEAEPVSDPYTADEEPPDTHTHTQPGPMTAEAESPHPSPATLRAKNVRSMRSSSPSSPHTASARDGGSRKPAAAPW